MIVIEILLLLTTFFPIYHMIDALIGKKQNLKATSNNQGFSILIPCYNEGVCIKKSIEAMLKIDYSNYEVIYINDGSDDNTLDELMMNLDLILVRASGSIKLFQSRIYPNYFCVSKPNTGKGLSLNTGIEYSKKEIIVSLDADSMLNHDCLTIMDSVFADENVVAAGGTINITQVYNSKYIKKQRIFKRILIKVQALDYLKGFFVYKLSLSKQNAMAIISGAFGVFRKEVLVSVNGYRKSLGEDIDITLKIQRHIIGTGKKVVYIPQAGCYTECPESSKDLFRQRVRWQKGFIDCVLHYCKFLFANCFKNPICFYLIIEALMIGIFSCSLPIASLIVLVFSFSTSSFNMFLLYWFIVVVFRIVYTFVAYIVASRYVFPYKRKLLEAIILDVLLLKPFLLVTYIFGTCAYMKNSTDWNKTKRSIVLSRGKEIA